ncbi:divergent PAP2 family protein [Candidatus Falkowbacteria bacterium]|nr:divergent PAP2 family protein [Candidatus Falkowbacteria bacterium]
MMQILIAPITAALIAQIAKLLIKSNGLKLDWQSFISYSGMPSSHAATVISLAASIGLTQGFSSPLFFISVILSFFIIRDALGVRNYVGQQGKILNNLIKNLSDNKIVSAEKYPRLVEKIGHTPAQIIAGALLGFLVSLIGYYIF